MRSVTMATLTREFSALSVDFDLWLGESDADPLIPDMVADLETKGLLEDDQGARIVRVAGAGETKKKKLEDGSAVTVESPDPLLEHAAIAKQVGRNPRIVKYDGGLPTITLYQWRALGRPVHGVRERS